MVAQRSLRFWNMEGQENEVDHRRFAPLLRQLREARGFTQKQLADSSGISERAIQDLERGRTRAPQFYTVARLADALSTTQGERESLNAAARPRAAGGAAVGTPAAATERPEVEPRPQQPVSRSAQPTKRRSLVTLAVAVVAGVVVLLGGVAFAFRGDGRAVITSPHDGDAVPGDVTVRGTADVQADRQLWLLVQPQHGDGTLWAGTREPIPVASSSTWAARVTIGRDDNDAGYPFRLVLVLSPPGGCVDHAKELLPPGRHYAKMPVMPPDCDFQDEIVVTRAR